MSNRDRFIDAVGKVSERHVKAHIDRVSPTGIRKYLVYPTSVAIYAAACVLVILLIPLIVTNIPDPPSAEPQGTVYTEVLPPDTTESTVTTTAQSGTTEPDTSEIVTTESVTEPIVSETEPVTETTPPETTTEPALTTPAPVPEPPKTTLNISEQVMLSPISAMRTINGIEFRVTVTRAQAARISEDDNDMDKYWKNHIYVLCEVENNTDEVIYSCDYYRAMFPFGAAIYADGEPTSADPSEYTTYFFVQDFDRYSGYQQALPGSTDEYVFKPTVISRGFSVQPPEHGSLYNGGDATVGKDLEIRAWLAVFDNPSQTLKNGEITQEDIDNLKFVEIVIPWDRNTVVEDGQIIG